eukprot:tig00020960_g16575.t1
MARVGKAVKGGAKAKKGGKKKGKDAGLRLEMDAYKNEEAMREKEEKMRARLREKQLAEERYAKLNMMKVQQTWIRIMRKAKVDELKKDIEIHSQNHEREVDRKDAIILMYDRDLDDAEEQYQWALRSHLQNVDELIQLQMSRVRALQDEFEKDLAILEEEFGKERAEIIAQHNAEKKELLEIMAAMEAEFNEQEQEMRQEFESQREEIKNKNQEEYNVLRITLESTIEELERHFESAHQNYVANTEQRTNDFKKLTTKDRESAKTIESNMRKLQRLHDALQHWKMKTANNVRECDERNRALEQEKDQIAAHFQELKAKMNRFREAEARRLTELTTTARSTIKKLKERLAQAEKIIKLAELNRKMETEREKVLPFYKSSVDEEEEQALQQLGLERPAAASSSSAVPAGSSVEAEKKAALKAAAIEGAAGPSASGSGSGSGGEGPAISKEVEKERAAHATAADEKGRPIAEWDYLNNFMKRYNKVLLDKVAMDREKERLQRENEDLRAILKQYLDGISVNEDVMAAVNPLLVVNSKLQLNIPPSQRPPPPNTTIEGNHEIVFQHVRA